MKFKVYEALSYLVSYLVVIVAVVLVVFGPYWLASMTHPNLEVSALTAWVMGIVGMMLITIVALVAAVALFVLSTVAISLKQQLVIKLYKMTIRSNSKLGTEIWLYTRKSLDKDDLTFYGG